MKRNEKVKAPFNKDRFLAIANGIFDGAYLTNCFLDLLEQLQSGFENYREEMKYSAGFYNYTYLSLITSITMELAKIYEKDGKSLTINHLINLFRDNADQFPQRFEGTINDGGETISISFPYKHTFSPKEIDLLRGKEDSLANRVLAEEKALKQIEGLVSDNSLPLTVSVDMSLQDYALLYRYKLKALSTARNNLSIQRNKLYAHNDASICFDFTTIQNAFPLTYDDIKNLTDFALEVSQRMIAFCTKVVKAGKPINLRCLDNTLELVRVGAKYQGQYILDEMETTPTM